MRKPSFRLFFLIAGNKKSPVRLLPCTNGHLLKGKDRSKFLAAKGKDRSKFLAAKGKDRSKFLAAKGKDRSKFLAARPERAEASFWQHALKGQKLLAQGSALGNLMAQTRRPVRAKALKYLAIYKAFALTGRLC